VRDEVLLAQQRRIEALNKRIQALQAESEFAIEARLNEQKLEVSSSSASSSSSGL
jgi:hypothetical protein